MTTPKSNKIQVVAVFILKRRQKKLNGVRLLPDSQFVLLMQNMQVIKRDGRREEVAFEKVQERIAKSSAGLAVNPTKVAQGVLTRLVDGITTTELDTMTAHLAYSWSTVHPDYGELAARIAISSHQKNTPSTFLEAVLRLDAVTDKTGAPASLLDPALVAVVKEHAAEIEAVLHYDRDFLLDYFGFKTLEKAYLLRDTARNVVERPQHLFLREALGLWLHDLPKAFETYELLSQKFYTHATPTLFNAGTKRPQLSSCFLLGTDDSIAGIYKTLTDCALISQYGGGIGLHISNIRAQGSLIKGTGGLSNGIVPMMRVFNNTARYVDQGGGKRNGSFAMYLEPWHADVEHFLEMKKNTGSEEERARDLFYALWVPDLFMERVNADADWTLFCPNEAPGLADVVGAEFAALYTRYEAEGRGKKTVKARKIWSSVMESQIETGTPYLLYKDSANLKSNQQNLGVIKSSNLCVAAHTPILTKGGELPIGMLVGQEVQVWNGDRWSTVVVEQTSTGAELLTVEFDDIITYNDGFVERRKSQLTCTFYHKFFRCEGDDSRRWQTSERVEAHRLEAGDRLGEWEDDHGAYHSPRVRAVIQMGLFAPTFCFTEAENHAGVFAGLLTGQCAEIIEYSSPTETAVCNLASMSLPAFVKSGSSSSEGKSKAFDFALFRKVVKVAIRNLNRVIDVNFYPIPEAEFSNKRHRPVGLGVQGLADVFAMMGYAWESPEAALLNKRIFAHMYHAALEASCDLAAAEGVYPTYHGSPMSKGSFQFDLWKTEPLVDDGLDWDTLGHYISRIGVRNSLLIAAMPTASTSQILGNCECMEPYATHIFTRRTLAGEFIVVNKHLVTALVERGLWSVALKDAIVANNGSVQGVKGIPDDIQTLFKTVWEIKQRTLVDMAADRGPYICQSQSLNLFLGDPDYKKLSSMHFYAWKLGLKTGIYYLRTRSVASAQKFTVDPSTAASSNTVSMIPSFSKEGKEEKKEEEPKECLMCSA